MGKTNDATAPTTDLQTLLTVGREGWAKHKNFPEQTLLLGSHENFRRVSALLLDGARQQLESDPHAAPVFSQLHLFRRWKSAMRSHEHYEEGKLYPYLRAKFGVSTDALETQHEDLHEIEIQVQAAFEANSAREVADALLAHDRLLREHLEEEEHLVIPHLLSLRRGEFRDFTQNSIAELLRTLRQTYS